jgi:acetate kinase
MLAVIDPHQRSISITAATRKGVAQNNLRLDRGWIGRLKAFLAGCPETTQIAYTLYNGGTQIRTPISRLRESDIATLYRISGVLPELNDTTLETARSVVHAFPDRSHYLACETAYFTALPDEATRYGLPERVDEERVRRFGGHGLLHQWVSRLSQAAGCGPKVVSVYIGNRSNLAAIENGAPKHTSIGFSPAEGIPSQHATGDIDPTLILQLEADGYSLAEVNDILTQRSGFSGMLGEQTPITDLAAPESKAAEAASEMLSYRIAKYIGAQIAVLGGLDALVFTSKEIRSVRPLVSRVLEHLSFLGARPEWKWREDSIVAPITGQKTPFEVFCGTYDRLRVVADMIQSQTHEQEVNHVIS